ncbi:hypothetical protein [Umezawaea sp. Da 62-37]|uniref:Rv1733c family protein n=1 Tax=Umezawaea sp. Da 62-37 TaxID=3075927 RepID=UPI0028F73202|nr:hypothetical protein [Umezawaea sp. Da 62-37]WNV84767.1 hypothetical protein RM788_42490 [Umezawaea sp. Da 62-37]
MSTPMAAPFVRLARRVFRSRHADAGDRFERVVLIAAIAVALLGIPIAAFLGSETYRTSSAASVEQLRTRHASTATLLADAPPATAAGAQPHYVSASWTAPDGDPRQGLVPAAPNVKAGGSVAIWLDDSGGITTHPLTPERAAITAIGVAFLFWSSLVCLMVGFCATATHLNKRMNSLRWEREWAVVEPEWTTKYH